MTFRQFPISLLWFCMLQYQPGSFETALKEAEGVECLTKVVLAYFTHSSARKALWKIIEKVLWNTVNNLRSILEVLICLVGFVLLRLYLHLVHYNGYFSHRSDTLTWKQHIAQKGIALLDWREAISESRHRVYDILCLWHKEKKLLNLNIRSQFLFHFTILK